MKLALKLILFSLLLNGCNHETDVCANVNIHNETKYLITLEAYNKKKLINTIEIPANKSYNTTYQTFGHVDNYLGVFSDNLDSVNIKFNNEKIIIQYCDGKNLSFCPNIIKNILLEWDKQVPTVGGSVKLFKKNGCQILKNPYEFYFDQSDYDRAVPIVK